jgi:hypothetical protein
VTAEGKPDGWAARDDVGEVLSVVYGHQDQRRSHCGAGMLVQLLGEIDFAHRKGVTGNVILQAWLPV